jgi:hypothetical protein
MFDLAQYALRIDVARGARVLRTARLLRALRTMRTLRALRALSMFQKLQAVVSALMRSVPLMARVVRLLLIVLGEGMGGLFLKSML